jgi:glucokinase
VPVLALDVGGTKLAAALVDDDGALRSTARVPTPADPWPACVALLEQVRGSAAVDGVGVGCGGPMRWPDGVVSPVNMPTWRDFPLRERVREQYGGAPVRLHNDAVCVTVGEHWRGAGRGIDDLLGMVVSTGVGGGLSLSGPPLWGPLHDAFAAHARLAFLDHVRVVPAALGGSAGLVGAGALLLAGDRYWSVP